MPQAARSATISKNDGHADADGGDVDKNDSDVDDPFVVLNADVVVVGERLQTEGDFKAFVLLQQFAQ